MLIVGFFFRQLKSFQGLDFSQQPQGQTHAEQTGHLPRGRIIQPGGSQAAHAPLGSYMRP
jgi:hypothetical protein